MTHEAIPHICAILHALELVAVFRKHHLSNIVLRLAEHRLLDQVVDIALLNLQIANWVVTPRPVSQTAHTQLASIVAESKGHPLRLCLAEVILLLRLLTECMPQIIQIGVDVLQTDAHIQPLLILRVTHVR